jgi:RNA polymerase sigma-70 factor, ECF subfamily
MNELPRKLEEGRAQFLALVADIRPELHRYCARMTGSVADGEDIVQDTLAKAYYELPQLKEMPAMKAWLFRIAHNRALDYLRRYEHRMADPIEEAMEIPDDAARSPESAVDAKETVRIAMSRFMELPPVQRSCVILKDVLDHSLEEIAELLKTTLPAVKAALHRGRQRLAALAAVPPAAAPALSPAVARYAELFNVRDWDGVRALLAEDVRLDVVSGWKTQGKARVGNYFTNYERMTELRFVPGWLQARQGVAVFGRDSAQPRYFIELSIEEGKVSAIRDYHHVPYLLDEVSVELAWPRGKAS